MKRWMLATTLLGCCHALAAGVFPAPGIVVGGPVDSNTVTAVGAQTPVSNAVRATRVLTLEEFGAAGDGVTDDSAAAAKACAASISPTNLQGAQVWLLRKQYALNSGWTIPVGCHVTGPGDPGNENFVYNPNAPVQQYFGTGSMRPMLLLGHQPIGSPFTLTGNTAATSTLLQNVSGMQSGLQIVVQIGDFVTGPGIPAGDTVLDANYATNQITLATPATATATGVSLSFQHQASISVNGTFRNTAVARQGVNLDPPHFQDGMLSLASYSGTAIFVGQAARISNVLTLGNALGIFTGPNAQWTLDEIRSDDLFGLWMDNVHDVSLVHDYEAWPFIGVRDGNEQVSYTVTGAANNGSNNLRLTLSSAHILVVGNPVTINGVGGMVGANNRTAVVGVPDSTHVDVALQYTFPLTGTLSTTSQDVTGIDTSHLAIGQAVSGPGIPAGTTITNIQVDTGVAQLSNLPTANGSAQLTITQAPYTSGGQITSSNTIRPNDCIRVDASEAPSIDTAFCFGHPVGLHLTSGWVGDHVGGAAWLTAYNLQMEGTDPYNPNSVGILIDGLAQSAKIHLGGDFGAVWSQVKVATTSNIPEPNLIEGGPMYSGVQQGYGPSNIRVVSGNLILSNTSACWNNIFLGASARLQISSSDCTFNLGYGYESSLAGLSTSGTLFSDAQAPNGGGYINTLRGRAGVALGVPNAGGNGWQFPLSVSAAGVVTAMGPIADASAVRVALGGGSYNVPAGTGLVRFTQTSTVASQTVALPACTVDTGRIEFDNYGGQITALSFSPAIAGWANGSTFSANTAFAARCDATDGLRHRSG